MRIALSFWRIFVGVLFVSLSTRMTKPGFRLAMSRSIFAFAVCIAIFSASDASAQRTNTLSCGSNGTIDLGAVLAGQTLHDSLFLQNSDSAKDSVFTITSSPTSGFSWSPSSSIHLVSGDSAYVTTIVFSDSSIGATDSTSIVFQPVADSACVTTFELLAHSVGPDTNNSIVPLNHTSGNIIAFKSDTSGQSLHIRLQNNFNGSITIDSLELSSDTAFRIDSISVIFPVTLKHDSSFTIKLSFIASNPGFYSDYISMPGQSILPLSVQGLLKPKDAVQIEPSAITYIRLYPNPSQGAVSIQTENLTKAQVTITDVLGRIEREASFHGDWQWDRETEGGGIAPAGTYFIIVTGTDANGKGVHQVERIVLE
ncbi:MAG: T9SS type A sorting domain-containing protein [Candidatus Kapaibacterium sp.]